MKLKALATLCKNKGKTATIFKRYDEDGRVIDQYIAAGGVALFCANDLPDLNEEMLLTIFDVPGKDKAGWTIGIKEMPAMFDLEMITRDEVQIYEGNRLGIAYGGHALKILYSRDEVFFVDQDLLSPTRDVLEDRQFWLRYANGSAYIVVKFGMIIQALIFPSIFTDDAFPQDLEKLLIRSRKAIAKYQEQKDREEAEAFLTGRETDDLELDGQANFDPETGEIFEDTNEAAETEDDTDIVDLRSHEERNRDFIKRTMGDMAAGHEGD